MPVSAESPKLAKAATVLGGLGELQMGDHPLSSEREQLVKKELCTLIMEILFQC